MLPVISRDNKRASWLLVDLINGYPTRHKVAKKIIVKRVLKFSAFAIKCLLENKTPSPRTKLIFAKLLPMIVPYIADEGSLLINIIEFISTKISGKEVAQASKVIPIKSSDKFSCLPIFRECSINEKEPFQSRPIPNASCKKGKRISSMESNIRQLASSEPQCTYHLFSLQYLPEDQEPVDSYPSLLKLDSL